MVNLKIISSPGCASCEKAKNLINIVVKDYDYLNIENIELVEHPEVAIHYGIMSSPGVVINEQLVFSGDVDEKKLRTEIEQAHKLENNCKSKFSVKCSCSKE